MTGAAYRTVARRPSFRLWCQAQKNKVGLLVLNTDFYSMPVPEIVPIIRGIDKDLTLIATSDHNPPDLEKQVRARKVFS